MVAYGLLTRDGDEKKVSVTDPTHIHLTNIIKQESGLEMCSMIDIFKTSHTNLTPSILTSST